MKPFALYFIIVLTALCVVFGGRSRSVLFSGNNWSEYLRTEGLQLERGKVYTLNSRLSGTDTLGIMLDPALPVCGWLSYGAQGWQLQAADSLLVDPDSPGDPGQVLLPFIRTNTNSDTTKYRFIQPGSITGPATLYSCGLVLNYPGGDKHNRISLKLDTIGTATVLLLSGTGPYGAEIPLSAAETNEISLHFGKALHFGAADSAKTLLHFADAGQEEAALKMKVIHDSVSITGAGQAAALFTSPQFIYRGIMFSRKALFANSWQRGVLGLFIGLIFFQLVYLGYILRFNGSVKNLQRTIVVYAAAIFNNFVLLGLPILIYSNLYTDRRYLFIWMVIGSNVIFSLLLFRPVAVGISKVSGRIFTSLARYPYRDGFFWIIAGLLAGGFTYLFYTHVHQEKLWQIPILNYTQFFTMIVLLLAGWKRFSSGWFWPFMLLAFIFFTWASKDSGSLLFNAITLLVVWLLFKKDLPAWKPRYIKLLLGLAVIGLVCLGYTKTDHFHSGAAFFKESKFYRTTGYFADPSDDLYKLAPIGDRQTLTEHRLMLSDIREHPGGLWNDMRIPPAFRSTFFSDYGLLFELRFGGLWFAVLLLANLGLLCYIAIKVCYTFFFAYKHSVGEKSLVTEYNRSKVIWAVYLLILLVVNCIYTLLSALMVLPLSGVSFPMISASAIPVVASWLLLIWLYLVSMERGRDNDIVDEPVLEHYKALQRKAFIYSITVLLLASVASALSLWRIHKGNLQKINDHAMGYELVNGRKDQADYWDFSDRAALLKNDPAALMELASSVVRKEQQLSKLDPGQSLKIACIRSLLSGENLVVLKSDKRSYDKLQQQANYAVYHKASGPRSAGDPALAGWSVSRTAGSDALQVQSSRLQTVAMPGIELTRTAGTELIASSVNGYRYITVNGKHRTELLNPFLSGVAPASTTIDAEATTLTGVLLEAYMRRIESVTGKKGKYIANCYLVDNLTGFVKIAAQYPQVDNCNDAYAAGIARAMQDTAFRPQLIYDNGSVALASSSYGAASSIKPLIGYAGLSGDPSCERMTIEDKGTINFYRYLAWSNNVFSGTLLRHLMLLPTRAQLSDQLRDDIGIGLDPGHGRPAIIDHPISAHDMTKPLDKFSPVLQAAIGSANIDFMSLTTAYVRIFSGRKLDLSYSQGRVTKPADQLSHPEAAAKIRELMKGCINENTNGTARIVHGAAASSGFDTRDWMAKTGTAERIIGGRKINTASYFFVCVGHYTIAVRVIGAKLDVGDVETQSAKGFFMKIMPLLKGYQYLN